MTTVIIAASSNAKRCWIATTNACVAVVKHVGPVSSHWAASCHVAIRLTLSVVKSDALPLLLEVKNALFVMPLLDNIPSFQNKKSCRLVHLYNRLRDIQGQHIGTSARLQFDILQSSNMLCFSKSMEIQKATAGSFDFMFPMQWRICLGILCPN